MRYFSKFLILLIVSGFIFYTGCEPDETDDPITDVRDRWTGTWMADETSTLYPNPITFTVNISIDPATESGVLISNFYHLGNAPEDRVKVNVTANSATIPQQTVCDVIINGTAIMSGSKINWEYFVNDGADLDQVTGVYTRIN